MSLSSSLSSSVLSSVSSVLPPAAARAPSAVALYSRTTADFAHKLAASQALLRDAAARYSPLTQASSLGAEDMVVTHLLASLQIDASIFVLDTGMLHAQTLALIGRAEARYGRTFEIYRPDAQAARFAASGLTSRASAFTQQSGGTTLLQSRPGRRQTRECPARA